MDENDKRSRRRRAASDAIAKIVTSMTGTAKNSSEMATKTVDMRNDGVGNMGKRKGEKYITRYNSTWSEHYLSAKTYYLEVIFRQSLRIPHTLFLKLKTDLVSNDPNFWSSSVDGIVRPGIQSGVKILACLLLLGSGRSLDEMDHCAQMGKETIWMYFNRFWKE